MKYNIEQFKDWLEQDPNRKQGLPDWEEVYNQLGTDFTRKSLDNLTDFADYQAIIKKWIDSLEITNQSNKQPESFVDELKQAQTKGNLKPSQIRTKRSQAEKKLAKEETNLLPLLETPHQTSEMPGSFPTEPTNEPVEKSLRKVRSTGDLKPKSQAEPLTTDLTKDLSKKVKDLQERLDNTEKELTEAQEQIEQQEQDFQEQFDYQDQRNTDLQQELQQKQTTITALQKQLQTKNSPHHYWIYAILALVIIYLALK